MENEGYSEEKWEDRRKKHAVKRKLCVKYSVWLEEDILSAIILYV